MFPDHTLGMDSQEHLGSRLSSSRHLSLPLTEIVPFHHKVTEDGGQRGEKHSDSNRHLLRCPPHYPDSKHVAFFRLGLLRSCCIGWHQPSRSQIPTDLSDLKRIKFKWNDFTNPRVCLCFKALLSIRSDLWSEWLFDAQACLYIIHNLLFNVVLVKTLKTLMHHLKILLFWNPWRGSTRWIQGVTA